MPANSRCALCGRLLLATGLMAVLSFCMLPRELDELRFCGDEPLPFSVESLSVQGLPTNRFLAISEAQPAADDVSATRHHPQGTATYVKLRLPEPLEAVRPVVTKLSGSLTPQEIQLIFAADFVLGYARIPATPAFPGIFDEQAELADWLGRPADSAMLVEILDAPPRRWRSLKLWGGLLGLLFLSGFGMVPWFQARIFKIEWTVMTGACGLAVIAAVIRLLMTSVSAEWNPLAVTAFAVFGTHGLICLVLSICRGATLAVLTPRRVESTSNPRNASDDDSPFRLTDTGFQILDGATVYSFKDADVIGFAVLLDNQVTDSGTLCRRIVRLRLKQGNTSEVLRIDDVVEADREDPMHAYLRRITVELTSRFERELTGGGELRGATWSLNRAELTVGEGDHAVSVGLKSIVGHDWILNDFCVWQESHEQPCLRVPADAENVHVLAALLPRFTGPQLPVHGEHGLGRLLLTVPAKSGLGRKLRGVLPGQASDLDVDRLHLLDDGIVLETDHSEHLHKCDEISGLARRTDKPQASLTIWIEDNPAPFRICVSRQDRSAVEAIRYCEETLAKAASHRLLQQLVAHGRVAWTPDVEICLPGIEVRSPDGSVRLIALSEILDLRVTEESVVVAHRSGSAHDLAISATERNALVGMFALKDLRSVYSDTCPRGTVPAGRSVNQ